VKKSRVSKKIPGSFSVIKSKEFYQKALDKTQKICGEAFETKLILEAGR
jgi:hypothetical protein